MRAYQLSFFSRQHTKSSHPGTQFSIATNLTNFDFAGLAILRKWSMRLGGLFCTAMVSQLSAKAAAFVIQLF